MFEDEFGTIVPIRTPAYPPLFAGKAGSVTFPRTNSKPLARFKAYGANRNRKTGKGPLSVI
jgi:hypothetical protein